MAAGRMQYPDDVGRAVVFLVGPDAEYVIGAVLRVDGA
jgi:NAD(P)-dependent dehydrogenase (short-subunit alcohol dehydrogenase family)